MTSQPSIADIPNLGEKSTKMLARAGIVGVDQLQDLGPTVAFLAVRQSGQNPSMNLLWAIAAGLENRHWTDLSEQEKRSLRAELDDLTR